VNCCHIPMEIQAFSSTLTVSHFFYVIVCCYIVSDYGAAQ